MDLNSTLKTKASEQAAKLNPASAVETRKGDAERIPMSVPTLRLAVPEIPGFHCHWFVGAAHRIQRALRAGYQFVEQDEVSINNFDLAGNFSESGSTDLGSRVSVFSGTDEQGNAQRLYLMKLPNHFREQDVEANIERNNEIAKALNGGTINGTTPEASYVKKAESFLDRKN